ncbi:MAG: oligosaccharide flippase family protein [Aliishimia sp.]
MRFSSEVVLRLVSTIVLTRLLAPEVYGIFAVVLVYMYLLQMFSDLGLRPLVLTKEDPVEDGFLHTCWTVSVLRGFAIWLISALLALTIGYMQSNGTFAPDNAYASPVLPWAIFALGGVSCVKGFMSINLHMAARGMLFGRATILHIAANLISLIVTIILAFYLRTVWALVIGNLTRVLIEVCFSFWIFPGTRMRLSLAWEHLLPIYDRGRWIVGQSALTALSESADRIFLGFAISSANFGHYAIARQVVDLFIRFIGTMNIQMGLQVFTHILKAEIPVFRKNYYRYRIIFDAISGICAGGILITAPFIVEILFDDRYANVATYMAILSLGLLTSSPIILRQAFRAERRFKEMMMLGLVTAVSIWTGLAVSIFVFDSVTLALFCIAFHKLPEVILLWIKGHRRGWISPLRETRPLIFVPVGALIGWVCLLLSDYLL